MKIEIKHKNRLAQPIDIYIVERLKIVKIGKPTLCKFFNNIFYDIKFQSKKGIITHNSMLKSRREALKRFISVNKVVKIKRLASSNWILSVNGESWH